MNTLTLKIQTIGFEEVAYVDEMEFSNCCLVKVFVDDENLSELFSDGEPLVAFLELELSAENAGWCLIFTCTCGIADCSGWEGVLVLHDEFNINWEFEYDDKAYFFSFEKQQYIDEVKRAKNRLEKSGLKLEPIRVVYPEAQESLFIGFQEYLAKNG